MGKIETNPNLMKRLVFLAKHASKALVTPNGISSRYITIQSEGISDSKFGVETKELLEMLKHTQDYQLEDSILKYSYTSTVGGHDVIVNRTIPTFEMQCDFDFKTPLSTIKLPFFKSISPDETTLEFLNNKITLETKGYIKTRLMHTANRVEGVESFSVKVRGTDLKIIEEIEGERVLCYFESSLVVFGFDKDTSMAVVIKCIQ